MSSLDDYLPIAEWIAWGGWIIVPAFFWTRGCVHRDAREMLAGLVLAFVFARVAALAASSTAIIHVMGLWFIGASLIAAIVRAVKPPPGLLSYVECAALALLGLFLQLLL